ncbi:hypothetical protein BDZ97DRAFT_1800624 [Flammula alnicola]|nr:hypothetical protein BDZ97DRAFT_1800624 [Flammula alnicola]
MPMPVIPLDVVEVILDTLACEDEFGDFTVLKACSFTCRAFLPLCRKHIFASITINKPNFWRFAPPSPKTKMLRKLLVTMPEIAGYVRKLRFGIRLGSFGKQDFIGLPEILTRLTRLNSLILLYYGHGFEKLDWKIMPLPMTDAMFCLMNLPTLTSLELKYFKNFPISALLPRARLQHLNIEFFDIAEVDDAFPAILPVAPIQLEDYTFGAQCGIGPKGILESRRSDGQLIFDLTNLKKITAYCYVIEDMDVTETILRRNTHLTMIHLSVGNLVTFSGFAAMITPSINTLKKLSFEISVYPTDCLLAGLGNELEKMAGRNVLEDLAIRVFVGCKIGDEWGGLDRVLSNSGWPALRRVSLQIVISAARESDALLQALENLPQTQLTGLSSSKTTNFDFKVKEREVQY